MHTIGAKWLRPNGVIQGFDMEEHDGCSGIKTVFDNNAAIAHLGENSGIMDDDVRHGNRLIFGENKCLRKRQIWEFKL